LQGQIGLFANKQYVTLQQAYTAADIFVMPNIPVEGDMEGFGIVLLEANIAGTPAVASDLEGIKDVIENGKNGFKNPVYDAEGFAEKIDLVISKHLPEMEISSKKYVEDNFAWNSVAKKYISYLDNVIQRVKS
ncbi:MAG: glycosyltransferase family 4 protein, partial [Bacteroidota bacterium]